MKKFRDKAVIGWRVINSNSVKDFEERINNLMDEYDFEDFQFSTCYSDIACCPIFTATILLSNKDDSILFEEELNDGGFSLGATLVGEKK